MNFHNPKQHRVWRPRMESGEVFNLFVRSTESHSALSTRTLQDIEEWTQESDAAEAKVEPAKAEPS